MVISIHAPREGSDQLKATVQRPCSIFLSTLPARGATLAYMPHLQKEIISIHAPREGSDLPGLPAPVVTTLTISIHAPREGSDFP